MRKRFFTAIASVAAAAALVVAPLVATSASATEPLLGTVGTIEPSTAKGNGTDYWEARYAAFDVECFKDAAAYGTVTDGSKTVTLSAPPAGKVWVVLVVKAATSNNVVEDPAVGTPYASPRANGGPQAAVSHWIVCAGDAPETTPTIVTPMLEWTLPDCYTAGAVTKTNDVDWSSLVDEVTKATTWTATPRAGAAFAEGFVPVWVVPNLEKLTASCDESEHPDPKVTTKVVTEFDCESEIAEITTTTTTISSRWEESLAAWVDEEPVVTTASATRALTAGELATCPPDTTVEYGEWADGVWACGDTTVIQTREITTTVFEFDEQGLPTGKSSVALETRERELTQSEIGTCPLVPGDIQSQCVGDVPYLGYDLTLPEGFVAGADPVTITFVNPDGEDYVVENQPLQGTLLWPGASADEPKMWPGWALVDGEYVETDGNYRWTRAGVTIVFEVNPTYETTVEYPQATALCASPSLFTTDVPEDPTDPSAPETLAVTGGAFSLGAVGLGALALAAGVTITVISAKRRARA
ncbi:hypothetical protein [Microbacterium sp. SS28]|uniref:hypothetical protein n=1 Tax=Microbacterium sp. SS28 TaxID=2919948 RepID=UPI001FA9DA0E|nr:hypothetical protein [Microbacterium sp. SS28]